MMTEIEIFYDFRSPYSYLALTQLVELPAQIALRPMHVLRLMEKVGNVPTTMTCRVKAEYARIDLQRWTKRFGLVLNPSDLPENDYDACARSVLSAQTSADALVITLALYNALFSEARTLARIDDILSVIQETPVDATVIAGRLDGPESTKRYDANTEEAGRRGAFGSPTMFVGDAMFFGNDRVGFVREEVARLETTS